MFPTLFATTTAVPPRKSKQAVPRSSVGVNVNPLGAWGLMCSKNFPFDAETLRQRDFWELLFPRRRSDDTGTEDPLVRAQPYDLPDAAGVIRRISPPFSIGGSGTPSRRVS